MNAVPGSTITSIFEGTQLVQLSLIASQLGQLERAGRRDGTPVDLDRLCNAIVNLTTRNRTARAS